MRAFNTRPEVPLEAPESRAYRAAQIRGATRVLRFHDCMG